MLLPPLSLRRSQFRAPWTNLTYYFLRKLNWTREGLNYFQAMSSTRISPSPESWPSDICDRTAISSLACGSNSFGSLPIPGDNFSQMRRSHLICPTAFLPLISCRLVESSWKVRRNMSGTNSMHPSANEKQLLASNNSFRSWLKPTSSSGISGNPRHRPLFANREERKFNQARIWIFARSINGNLLYDSKASSNHSPFGEPEFAFRNSGIA